MTARRSQPKETPRPSFPGGIVAILALAYIVGAAVFGWGVVAHSEASTQAIEQILKEHSLKNEASESLDRYTREHPLLGTLLAPPVRGAMKLPSSEQAEEALHSEVLRLLRQVRAEATEAAWRSWLLVSLSALYVAVTAALERSLTARGVLFALTCVSLTSFLVGILAPAMIIWTEPSVPIGGTDLKFVMQHEIRGIAAIIRQLLTTGHWIIGGFLFLFSIVTPLTKASLTFFVTFSRSRERNERVWRFLHSIGKWSMADVFVAGTLLALYALKFQQATKSMVLIGLSYFIGYCLISMTTTELLGHSEAAGRQVSPKKLGPKATGLILAGALSIVLGSAAYTYRLYPPLGKERPAPSSLPQRLHEADLTPAAK